VDFKDIKTWGVLLSIVVAIGGGFAKFGEISNRLAVLEKKSAPNIKPLEQSIAINKAEIAVLKSQVVEIKARSDNPLQ
tara:strand:- start:4688 stop:4921 length:234 start_codon:yes stop_codon:yes gene_type:complete